MSTRKRGIQEEGWSMPGKQLGWFESRAHLISTQGVADKEKKVTGRSRDCHLQSPKYLIRAESGNVTRTTLSVSLR